MGDFSITLSIQNSLFYLWSPGATERGHRTLKVSNSWRSLKPLLMKARSWASELVTVVLHSTRESHGVNDFPSA